MRGPRGDPGRGAGEHRTEPAGRGDQRPRFLRHHPEVVREGILARARADGLGDLAAHQPAERFRLDPDRLVTQISENPGRLGEQEIPGQDGDRVGPP